MAGVGSIDVPPEVVAAVGGRTRIIVDGGSAAAPMSSRR
jgi:isopentenyl diphosphate isomerase/L-lactate dehydrogenase-like FMN-dependent dehydrogenase